MNSIISFEFVLSKELKYSDIVTSFSSTGAIWFAMTSFISMPSSLSSKEFNN